MWILIAYGFVYTPIISYVAARMEGVAGQWVEIPMVREATFIAAQTFGYRGVGIWFAPIPIHNYAGSVVAFRTQELTGTKFTSLIKSELVLYPIVIVSSIFFSQYLWRLAPIPSAIYPYANQLWELQARQMALMQSSTLGNSGGGAGSMFYEAIKWKYIAGSSVAGIFLYSGLSLGGAPVMLCYGLVRGLAPPSPPASSPNSSAPSSAATSSKNASASAGANTPPSSSPASPAASALSQCSPSGVCS